MERKILLAIFVSCCVSLPIKKDKIELNNILTNIVKNDDSSLKCVLCKSTVTVLHLLMQAGYGESVLVKIADVVCKKFRDIIPISLTEKVCVLAVHEWNKEIWQLLAHGVVESDELCGLIIGEQCAHTKKFFPPWNVTIPPPTIFTPTSSDIGVKTGKGASIKVLHITDTHLDNDYMEGAVAKCKNPLCCRKQDGLAKKGEAAAGKYGYAGYCDSNIAMLHKMFQHIKDNHDDLDYILWTGDVPAHNVWNQSRSSQKNMIHQATSLIRHYFPNKRVFPTLGNHEGVPVNAFPAPEIWRWGVPSSEWLYSSIAVDWGRWLPTECNDTITKGGFYTTLIHPGLRLVSVNTNYGHVDNWWLTLMSQDPADQLQWLVNVLTRAEINKEKVHIIGHQPPGGGNLYWWSLNFYKIVDRFRHTITGQFYGHTHHDEFRLFYDMKTFKLPINIAYVAPSVTTYSNLNPGYRIYELDGGDVTSSMSVVDHQTYIMNLNISDNTEPMFELEYSARDAYHMRSLSAVDWDNLLKRMLSDDHLFQVLYLAWSKQHYKGPCDDKCKRAYICSMKKALTGHNFCTMNEQEEMMFSKWEGEMYNKC